VKAISLSTSQDYGVQIIQGERTKMGYVAIDKN
jgi:hypothetical protein